MKQTVHTGRRAINATAPKKVVWTIGTWTARRMNQISSARLWHDKAKARHGFKRRAIVVPNLSTNTSFLTIIMRFIYLFCSIFFAVQIWWRFCKEIQRAWPCSHYHRWALDLTTWAHNTWPALCSIIGVRGHSSGHFRVTRIIWGGRGTNLYFFLLFFYRVIFLVQFFMWI